MAELRVGDLLVLLDLSQQENRYIYFGVLQGMRRFLAAANAPTIMCEVTGVGAARARSLAAVEKLLMKFDYRAHRVALGGRLIPISLNEIQQLVATMNFVFLPNKIPGATMSHYNG